MTPRHKRLALALGALLCTGLAVALVLNAFRSNIVFFYSPSDVRAQQTPKGATFRLGGLVETASVVRQADGVTVHFTVTDTAQRVPVRFRGILPDLFKEGKGVIAQGRMASDGLFDAQDVLAKHDENYMPPEAADALERARKAQTAAHPITPPTASTAPNVATAVAPPSTHRP